MENLKYPCIYLCGVQLWIALALFCILILGFILVGRCYLAAERKADRLQVKYNNCRADLRAAELELKGLALRRSYGQSGTPVPAKEVAASTMHPRNDKVGAVSDG